MKKILLVGKLNNEMQDIYECLSRRFHVQISAEQYDFVKGMLRIVKPDMLLISLAETEDIQENVLELLEMDGSNLPVLIMGSQEACRQYEKYYKKEQFVKMLFPFKKDVLINTCYQLLEHETAVGENETYLHESEDCMKHILVVDDSSVTLRSIKAMLDKNYRISVAMSGKQAMKSIQKERPDLILLDYEMPDCDGRQTLEMIRADEEMFDIPVIFLTGVADKEHIAAVLKLNPAGYFLKPAEREKLLQAIADVFEKEKEEESIWDIRL